VLRIVFEKKSKRRAQHEKARPPPVKGTSPFVPIPVGLLISQKPYGGECCIPVNKVCYPLFILAEIEFFVNNKIYSFI
jgi:hypothetical protein